MDIKKSMNCKNTKFFNCPDKINKKAMNGDNGARLIKKKRKKKVVD